LLANRSVAVRVVSDLERRLQAKQENAGSFRVAADDGCKSKSTLRAGMI
jgi:hypothetical protein